MPDPAQQFTAAYRAHHPDVLHFVRRRAEPAVADDVVAEAFTIAWRRWADAPDDVRPWLFGIAHRVLADARRSRGRRDALHLRVAANPPPGSPDEAGTVTELAVLRDAWDRLDDHEREAIALVAWDGLTGREAALVLGCTRVAFAARLSRARRRLRTLLEEPAGGPTPSLTTAGGEA